MTEREKLIELITDFLKIGRAGDNLVDYLLSHGVSVMADAEKKNSPFERIGDKEYYFITSKGTVRELIEHYDGMDCELFAIANYCADKTMMEQRALHELLNRLLWRYSEEHGGSGEWDTNKECVKIVFDVDEKEVKCGINVCCKDPCTVYFKDEATAQDAIEKIVKPFLAEHPEFAW